MSIRPMDINNIYLRMGEVSREQDKEIKKEEREQSFQKRIQIFREENFDHTVNQARASHADKTVKEHEDRGLPAQKKQKDEQKPQLSSQELALPMATITTMATAATLNENNQSSQNYKPLDPDLGQHIDIES